MFTPTEIRQIILALIMMAGIVVLSVLFTASGLEVAKSRTSLVAQNRRACTTWVHAAYGDISRDHLRTDCNADGCQVFITTLEHEYGPTAPTLHRVVRITLRCSDGVCLEGAHHMTMVERPPNR